MYMIYNYVRGTSGVGRSPLHMWAAALAWCVPMPATPGVACVKAFHRRATLDLYVLWCCAVSERGTITRLSTATCRVTRWAWCGGRHRRVR